jgi:hypothetical protein
MRPALALFLGMVVVATAQSYKCDWSVVSSGGGEMSSATYCCGTTAGQTAAGFLIGTEFLALVGFWQTDYQVGIAEKQGRVFPGKLGTRLEAVAPNPFRDRTRVHYSLATRDPVRVVVLDLAGRAVRTLVNGPQSAGRYAADWSGDDDLGRKLANGVYFCKFTAGDHQEVRKLLLTR